jgi:hypothetical protein
MAILFSVAVREMQPFIKDSTNALLVIAQYQVLATFLAACKSAADF